MGNGKTYVEYADLPEVQQDNVKVAEKVQKKVAELQGKVVEKKDELKVVTGEIKEYLERNKLDGVKDDPALLYLRSSGSTPSFNQVLEAVQGDIPQTVAKKLQDAYETLVQEKKNGNIVVVKLS